jgi:hypothetical protein
MTVSATPYPLFWVAGTVTHMGRGAPDHETTTFDSLEICRLGGKVDRFTTVHAAGEIAALVEHNCIGTFFFWSRPGERRLWCVARADGPRSVDLAALQKIIPEIDFDTGGAPDAR